VVKKGTERISLSPGVTTGNRTGGESSLVSGRRGHPSSMSRLNVLNVGSKLRGEWETLLVGSGRDMIVPVIGCRRGAIRLRDN